MLASPVMWFPTNSKGRGKIWWENKGGDGLKIKTVTKVIMCLFGLFTPNAYFKENTSVKILELDCFARFGSIQDNKSGDHLKGPQ